MKANNPNVSNTTRNVKGARGRVSAKGPKKGTNSVLDTRGLSAKQRYSLAKQSLQNQKLAIKGRPGLAKSIGSGIREAITPVAASLTANKTAEQYAASKRAAADSALAAWNTNIGGNPSGEGSEGKSQGASSTETTSAGTFKSVLD